MATNNYLNQCWSNSLKHMCGTRGRWVNIFRIDRFYSHIVILHDSWRFVFGLVIEGGCLSSRSPWLVILMSFLFARRVHTLPVPWVKNFTRIWYGWKPPGLPTWSRSILSMDISGLTLKFCFMCFMIFNTLAPVSSSEDCDTPNILTCFYDCIVLNHLNISPLISIEFL